MSPAFSFLGPALLLRLAGGWGRGRRHVDLTAPGATKAVGPGAPVRGKRRATARGPRLGRALGIGGGGRGMGTLGEVKVVRGGSRGTELWVYEEWSEEGGEGGGGEWSQL